MPRKVKLPSGGPKSKVKSKSSPQNLTVIPGGKLNNFLNDWSGNVANFKTSKSFYLIILVLGLLLLFFYKKSWFVAAMVNNTPVTNLELQSKLNEQYRSQILTQLINEKIILMEANKNGSIPTEAEVNQKLADLEKNVGGKDVLNSLLSQQGQTRNSLISQVKVQLAISKLYEKEATVSSEEITQFIEQNKQSLPSYDGKDQLSASESAKLEKEAIDSIKNQKISQIFSQKFQELRQKAKIQIF